MPQGIVIVNKPGAAGVIGWQEVIRAKPDGYKVALTTVEMTFLHYLAWPSSTSTRCARSPS